MSVIDSDDELEYNLADIEALCQEEIEFNLEDLIVESKTKDEPLPESDITNVIYDIDLGQDILAKYKLALDSNTPINFIYVDSQDNYYSLFDKLRNQEDIIALFNQYNRLYRISITNFILAYYAANQESDKNFLIAQINKLSRASGLELDKDNFEEEEEKWQRRLFFLTDRTNQEYQKVQKFYSQLAGMEYTTAPEEMAASLKLKETTVSFKIKDGVYDFAVDNGAIIFNNMITSYYFPFIQYQGLEEQFYKLYDQENLVVEEVVKANDKINKLMEEENKKEHYIFALMRLLYKNKDQYVLLEFDLKEEKLTFSYPGNTLDYIKNKLPSLLEDIILEREKTLNVSGEFEMNFPNYDNTKLYFLTFFESIINKFLYVKEENKPRSLVSERDKYYFKTYAESSGISDYSASFFVEPLYADKYAIIFRSKVISNNSINEFALILSKLAWYYNHLDQPELMEQFDLVVQPYTGPDGSGLGAPLSEKKERKVAFKTSKIDNLLSKAPEMFPKSEYSRRCGCPKQPIIIDPDDVADWQKYRENGKAHEVVTFPPPKSPQKGKRYDFVCPTENNVLSFIPNPDYTSDYPILPCCTAQKKSDLYEKYDEIRENPSQFFSEKEESRTRAVQLKTVKTLSTDQEGFLPEELQDFLNVPYPNNKFTRFGVLKNSKSSFFHCLLLASQHLGNLKGKNEAINKRLDNLIKIRTEYLKRNITKREILVNNLRKNMEKLVHLECASQENFNLKGEQISRRIANLEEVFDSEFYYKLMEDMFFVNIFVFIYQDGQIYLEQPYHRFFHIREINMALPTVILFKHISTRTFPIYEIIKSTEPVRGSELPFLYTDVLTRYLKKYVEKNAYFICQAEEDNKYDVRKNYYQNINWNYLLADYEIVGQAINDSGRAYRINIMLEGDEISLYIPPSFPLNVAISEKIGYGQKADIRELFESECTAGSEGLWFNMNGQSRSVFVPCEDMSSNDAKCIAYELEKEKKRVDESFFQLNTISRNANIIKQLIIWCWNLSALNEVDDWFTKYVIKSKNREENEVFNHMPITMEYRFPPDIKDTLAGIKYLSYYIPLIFKGEYIYLYEQFYDSMKQYMMNYKLATTGLPKVANKAIINAFTNEQDFKELPYTRIIIGTKNWNEWVNFVTLGDKISQNIEESDADKIRPFLYQHNNGHIYLVQNIICGNISIALLLTKVWSKTGINLGYYTSDTNIWKCLEKDTRILATIGLDQKTILEKANRISDRPINTFCDAVQFLDRNEIKYEEEDDCHYYLYHRDGAQEKKGNCKNEYQEIFQYDNGTYAAMLLII